MTSVYPADHTPYDTCQFTCHIHRADFTACRSCYRPNSLLILFYTQDSQRLCLV